MWISFIAFIQRALQKRNCASRVIIENNFDCMGKSISDTAIFHYWVLPKINFQLFTICEIVCYGKTSIINVHLIKFQCKHVTC